MKRTMKGLKEGEDEEERKTASTSCASVIAARSQVPKYQVNNHNASYILLDAHTKKNLCSV